MRNTPHHFNLMRLAFCDTRYGAQTAVAKLATALSEQDIQGCAQLRSNSDT